MFPAGPRVPEDRAKVEAAVQQVERRITAPLRYQTLFSRGELRQTVAPPLAALNERPFQSGGVRGVWSRHGLATKHEPWLRLEEAARERKTKLTDEQIDLLERFSREFRKPSPDSLPSPAALPAATPTRQAWPLPARLPGDHEHVRPKPGPGSPGVAEPSCIEFAHPCGGEGGHGDDPHHATQSRTRIWPRDDLDDEVG